MRCIKPNDVKSPSLFDEKRVGHQVSEMNPHGPHASLSFIRRRILLKMYPESEGFRENFFNENIFRHLTGGLSGADGKFAR